MAATACVMSSVVAAGSAVCSSAAAATKRTAFYNVLLSSHRASFKTGVAVPSAARSSVFRAVSLDVSAMGEAKRATENGDGGTSGVDDSALAFAISNNEELAPFIRAAFEIGKPDTLVPLVQQNVDTVGVIYSDGPSLTHCIWN